MKFPFGSRNRRPLSGASPITDRHPRQERRNHTRQTASEQPAPALTPASQAATPSGPPSISLKIHLLRHIQVFFYALGQMHRALFSSTMTVLVIAISLALPTGLHIILKNAQRLSGGWQDVAQISLFMKTALTEAQILKLRDELAQRQDVIKVDYVSREQGLEQFSSFSGFGDVLKALDDNPIPAVLLVRPRHTDPLAVQQLLEKLSGLTQVDMAQLDMQWLQRLHAMMDIGQRSITMLGILLGLAVLLIVSNTIRLMIQNRREEIEITKLFGGTNAFIRRPFLYSGLLHGLLGGLVAWLLIGLMLLLLTSPVQQLAVLYQSDFNLQGLGLTESLILISGSALLGIAGAYVAVGRHLREIEPR